ncbi:MAG: hypothetical protein AAB250_12430 [Bdellovibrionota bacterium]
MPGVINEWTRAQNIAADGLVQSIQAVVKGRSVDDRTLAQNVRAASRAIAPLIVRRRP